MARQQGLMCQRGGGEFLLGGVLANCPATLRDGGKNSLTGLTGLTRLSRLSPQSPL